MLCKSNEVRLTVAIVVGAFAILPFAVTAQETGAREAVLEEVVVTARRRTESLQDVPISVIAYGTEELEFRGIEQIADLSTAVPNVSLIGSLSQGEHVSQFSIRGIPGVGTFVDGLWQSSGLGLLRSEIVEVERVEVLRGPQGTLFGKNTTGGAISIITARPTDKFGARVTLTAGSYDRQDINASIDVPLSDNLRTKWTVASLKQDGFVTSVTTGRAFGDTNNTVFRGDIVWEPSDNLDIRFFHETNGRKENGSARVVDYIVEDGSEIGQTIARPQYFTAAGVDYTNQSAVAGYPGGDVGEFETRSGVNIDGLVVDASTTAVDMNWRLTDSLSLKSITGFIEHTSRVYGDVDAAEFTMLEDDRHFEVSQFTQELQLTGDVGERATWVAGVYYWDETEEQRRFRWTMNEFRTGELDFSLVQAAAAAMGGGVTLNPGPSDEYTGETTDGWAAFGEGTVALTDRLNVSLGLRYQEEHLESYAKVPTNMVTDFLAFGPGDTLPGDLFDGSINSFSPADFESTTGKLALQYSLNDSVMMYASYAQGFSAGGVDTAFVGSDLLTFPYDPEEVETIEAGLRSDWLDRRLRFNASIFSSDWTGIQLLVQAEDPNNPGAFLPTGVVSNAGAGEVSGGEIEIILLPSEHWRFDLNMGFLNTEYTETGTTDQIEIGDTFQQAPELTYSVGAQWNTDWSGGGSTIARLDWAWTDDYERARNHVSQRTQESFGLLNAYVTYEPPENNWQLSVFGTNLTNQQYLNSGFFTGGFGVDMATVGRPREGGIRLKFFFD